MRSAACEWGNWSAVLRMKGDFAIFAIPNNNLTSINETVESIGRWAMAVFNLIFLKAEHRANWASDVPSFGHFVQAGAALVEIRVPCLSELNNQELLIQF